MAVCSVSFGQDAGYCFGSSSVSYTIWSLNQICTLFLCFHSLDIFYVQYFHFHRTSEMCCNYVSTVRYKRCFFILCLKRKNCSDIFLNILCTEQVVIYWAEAGVRAGAACRFRLQPEGWLRLRLQSMPIRCCLIKGFKNFFKWSIINHTGSKIEFPFYNFAWFNWKKIPYL